MFAWSGNKFWGRKLRKFKILWFKIQGSTLNVKIVHRSSFNIQAPRAQRQIMKECSNSQKMVFFSAQYTGI
jgi:hypothetical protein